MKKRPLLAYFILVFAWIWTVAAAFFLFPVQVTAVFGEMSSSNPLFILATWGPNIMALAITALTGGWQEVLELLKKFTIWRVGAGWYLFVLLGIPALGLAAALLAGTFSSSLLGQPDSQMLSRLLPVLFNILITGALGEELGWRGFALPRLLRRWNPLTSSLILGTIWGVWHLPGFLASGTPQQGLSLPAFVLGAISLSILTTWIFLHTKGSVLLSALVHFAANFSLNALGAPLLYFSALLLLLMCGVIASRSREWFTRQTYLSASS